MLSWRFDPYHLSCQPSIWFDALITALEKFNKCIQRLYVLLGPPNAPIIAAAMLAKVAVERSAVLVLV